MKKVVQLNTKLFTLCCATLALTAGLVGGAPNAHAAANDAISIFEMLFGGPAARTSAKNHSGSTAGESCSGYDGVMGMVNSFFCHMEKDMGITTLGSKTVTFNGMSVHASISESSSSVTIGSRSIATTHVGQVWTCTSGCTSTGSFTRMYYIAFKYGGSGAINQGYVVAEPGVMSGATGSAMSMLYDVGTSTTTKYVDLQAKFTSGVTSMKMRAVGEVTSGVMSVNFTAYFGGNGFRFAGATDQTAATQYYKMYYENGTVGAGTDAADAASTGSGTLSPSSTACFSAVESGNAMTTASVAAGNCSGLSLKHFDTLTSTLSAGYSQDAIWARSGTTWNGMPASPPEI